MILLLLVVWVIPVEVFALCLVLFRLFRERCFGRVILALQASRAVHLGVDDLNVVRHFGQRLARMSCVAPCLILHLSHLHSALRPLAHRIQTTPRGVKQLPNNSNLESGVNPKRPGERGPLWRCVCRFLAQRNMHLQGPRSGWG